MSYSVGSTVKIDKCDECPSVVGTTATVRGLTPDNGEGPQFVEVKFGRGRPPANRPRFFKITDVSFVSKDA